MPAVSIWIDQLKVKNLRLAVSVCVPDRLTVPDFFAQ